MIRRSSFYCTSWVRSIGFRGRGREEGGGREGERGRGRERRREGGRERRREGGREGERERERINTCTCLLVGGFIVLVMKNLKFATYSTNAQ